MLTAQSVSLSLRKRPVLKTVSAQFKCGQVSAIIGPNGAGKSSLLKCLAGLIAPDGGTVLAGEDAPYALPPFERARRIAFLGQQPEIAWDVDVAHLVGLGRLPHQKTGKQGIADCLAIQSAMDRADVARFAGRAATRLSGGEKARVHLARMLAVEARWLLTDEPFAALDPAHQLACAQLLREEANRGAGVVLVLHDLTLAANLADHILLLKDGEVMAEGTPSEILQTALLSAAFGMEMHVDVAADGGLTITPNWSML